VADLVRLTVVGSRGEADIIRSLLHTAGIKCADRAADPVGSSEAWREILVEESDLEDAREVLASARAD
jgi:hypothetical protein